MIDRSEVSRALAKAIAYKQSGKSHEANIWARELVYLLECASILAPHKRLPFVTSLRHDTEESR